MTVELIEDKKIWDNFVDESPYGVLSHKWDFLKIAEKYSGYRLHTYGVYKGDKLLGIYPLFYKKIKGFKTIFSPPFRWGIPYLGFLVAKEYDSLKQNKKESFLSSFLGEMETEIQKYSPDYMQIHTVPNFIDMRFFNWNNYSVKPKYTYAVDLNRPTEDIWNNFHKDLRRDISRAGSSGLELRAGDDMSILLERQERRYREKASSFSLDTEYMDELFKAYPDNIKVYYMYNDEGEVVSASNSQEYKGRFLGWMGMAKTVGNANELLAWRLIELAKSKGLEKFEIAGADVRNQCIFKSKFNPSLEVCYHVYKKSMLGKIAEWSYANLYERHISQRRIVRI